MIIVDFEPKHVEQMDVQNKQLEMLGESSMVYSDIVHTGPAVTGIHDGKVIFCCGKNLVENKWVLWSLLSKHAAKHMITITRIGRRLIELQRGYGELFAIVRSDFPEGKRWVEMLGFNHHKSCPGQLPGGLDCDVYVRMC